MNKTKIEYLDSTWNPIAMRCTPVSEGCDHCWHRRMANRLHKVFDARRKYLRVDSNYYRSVAYSGCSPWMNTDELSAPLRLRKPARIGVQFMGDLFHDSIPNEWIAAVFGVMAACPQHTFFVLTKRAQQMFSWFKWVDCEAKDSKWTVAEPGAPWWKSHQCVIQAHEILGEIDMPSTAHCDWPLTNVLLGVSVENQKQKDRIYWLLNTPASKRFVSLEPLLEYIHLRLNLRKLDLIIAGAETGPGARPAQLDWFRSIRDQCAAAGTPFFLKQVTPGVRELDGRLHEEMP